MGGADRRGGVMLHQNPWRPIGGAEAAAWANGWHQAHRDLCAPAPEREPAGKMTHAPSRPRTLRVVLSNVAYARLRRLNARYRLASRDIVLVLLEELDGFAEPSALDRTLRDRAAGSGSR